MSRPTIPELIVKNVEDRWNRENFVRIQRFFSDFPLFRGEWKFFELEFASAVTAKEIPHGLDFVPLDIIQTRLLGPGSLTWEYALFDRTKLVVTTTGACSVRAFIGAYKENNGL